MKIIFVIAMVFVSFSTQAQNQYPNQEFLIGTSLTGYGGIIEGGFKINNVKLSMGYNFSFAGEHKHCIIEAGYSIPLISYDDGDWEHELLITPSIGYTFGSIKTEIPGKEAIVESIGDKNILYKIEGSYRVSRLEMFINYTKSKQNYMGIGWRGYF